MTMSPTDRAREIVKRLGGKWHNTYGMACCPAHNDRTPSLSVRPGDHIVMFHCFAGCPPEAIRAALDSGKITYATDSRNEDRKQPARDNSQLARDIWHNALPLKSSPAEMYLHRRGIAVLAHGRYEPKSITYEDGEKLTLPALILPIRDRNGITGIQRIFLDRATGAKSMRIKGVKRALGNLEGGTIRLGEEPTNILHLAEGLEDAGAAMLLHSLPHCWAACGIERYGQIDIPDQVKVVVIWSQHGAEAERAIERAREHLTANGRILEVRLPPSEGDWNDLLLARQVPVERPALKEQKAPKEILRTPGGPIWVTRYPVTGALRLWWPARSPISRDAKRILQGRARWSPSHRAWFVSPAHAEAVQTELLQIRPA